MPKQKYESDIQLGERYMDSQTGYDGIATGIYFFQHACERVCLERINPHSQQLETETFDSPRLVHHVSGDRAQSTRPGGPDRGSMTRPGVKRAEGGR
jgi:hypothetical protein